MKVSELKDITVEDLNDKLALEGENLSKLRLNNTVSELESPIQIRAKRREVARIKTEMRRRELQNK